LTVATLRNSLLRILRKSILNFGSQEKRSTFGGLTLDYRAMNDWLFRWVPPSSGTHCGDEMADGGASSMIMLVTGLLISGSASVILIAEWSDMVRVAALHERSQSDKHELGVAISGDHAMVAYDATAGEITLFLVNTGEHELNTTNYQFLVDGEAPVSASGTILPSGTDWLPGYLAEVVLTDTNWNYSDGDDVSVFFVGTSESVNGIVHSVTTDAEVRLNVV